ncbi:MAG TPA: peptidylprolyl isomerase [Verrucomicrobiae bacterium]|nr:peptidylprolyl isomerase [Verrucomicrobiae bacterium]
MKRIATWFLVCACGTLAPAAMAAQAAAGQSSTAPKHAAPAHPVAAPSLLHPATLKAKAPDVYEVKFATTKGDFVVKVTRAWAPLGADRFYNLVKHGFFTNASFFRVVPGFVVQFGISADPKINAVWDSAAIKDEPVAQSNQAGFLTFAMGGPNSRTTQIFINLRDNGQSLDKLGFAPFGQVTSGMDVVQQLYSGYGDLPEMGGHGPSEDAIARGGKAYLDKNFPMLDSIKTATVTFPPPASGATPAKPAAPPKKP